MRPNIVEDIPGVEVRGLCCREPHGTYHHPWASRDYKDIDCQAVGCMYNKNEKCSVPSLCRINDNGGCDGFKVKPLMKVEGD